MKSIIDYIKNWLSKEKLNERYIRNINNFAVKLLYENPKAYVFARNPNAKTEAEQKKWRYATETSDIWSNFYGTKFVLVLSPKDPNYVLKDEVFIDDLSYMTGNACPVPSGEWVKDFDWVALYIGPKTPSGRNIYDSIEAISLKLDGTSILPTHFKLRERFMQMVQYQGWAKKLHGNIDLSSEAALKVLNEDNKEGAYYFERTIMEKCCTRIEDFLDKKQNS